MAKFGHYIRMLHCSTDQTMTNALASMDLTAAQGHIMAFVAHTAQPPCARDIEEAFHLSHPTVSGILARLEKKGFLEFRPDAQDRRCKRIYILPKGKQLLATMHNTIEATEAKLVEGFTEEEQVQFGQYLSRALENLGMYPCKRENKEDNCTND